MPSLTAHAELPRRNCRNAGYLRLRCPASPRFGLPQGKGLLLLSFARLSDWGDFVERTASFGGEAAKKPEAGSRRFQGIGSEMVKYGEMTDDLVGPSGFSVQIESWKIQTVKTLWDLNAPSIYIYILINIYIYIIVFHV